jgi:hypothetical protein
MCLVQLWRPIKYVHTSFLLVPFYLPWRMVGFPQSGTSASWLPLRKQATGVVTSWDFDLLSQLSWGNPFLVASAEKSELDQLSV